LEIRIALALFDLCFKKTDMKNRVNQTETSLYFSGYTRVAIAIFIALLLILLSTKRSFFELIEMPRFYGSICFGFIIALLLIELIYWINVILDHFYRWQQWQWRLPLQLSLGIGPLLYFDWLLVKGMYLITGNDFEKSEFTERILPINLGLICIGHLIFYIRQRWIRNKGLQNFQESKKAGELQIAIEGFPILHSLSFIQNPLKLPAADQAYWTIVEGSIQNKKYTFPLNAICCLVAGSVYGDIYLKDGRHMNMSFRKTILRNCLDPSRFIEIRGGVFFAYDVIAEIKTQGNSSYVILNIENQNDLPLSISRRFFPTFMAGFKAYQANQS
jgi:hypothetical protein